MDFARATDHMGDLPHDMQTNRDKQHSIEKMVNDHEIYAIIRHIEIMDWDDKMKFTLTTYVNLLVTVISVCVFDHGVTVVL